MWIISIRIFFRYVHFVSCLPLFLFLFLLKFSAWFRFKISQQSNSKFKIWWTAMYAFCSIPQDNATIFWGPHTDTCHYSRWNSFTSNRIEASRGKFSLDSRSKYDAGWWWFLHRRSMWINELKVYTYWVSLHCAVGQCTGGEGILKVLSNINHWKKLYLGNVSWCNYQQFLWRNKKW